MPSMEREQNSLKVRVQTIAVIDLFLTICLFAELLPKTTTSLQNYIEHLYKLYYSESITTTGDSDVIVLPSRSSTSVHVQHDLDDNSVYIESMENNNNLTFWWVFKDIFCVAGLLAVFMAILGLIRSTNLQVLNSPEAVILIRNWLLSNILVVLIITSLIIFNLPYYPGGEGMEVTIAGGSVYLFGRGAASYSVWKFLQMVNNNLRLAARASPNGAGLVADTNIVSLPSTTG